MTNPSGTLDTSPGEASAGRRRIAETRRRLGAHVGEAAAYAAPSRLLSAGVDAVKSSAEAGVDRVSAAAADPAQRPPLLTAVGAAVSLLLGWWARRRQRARPTFQGRATTVVRTGSPWLSLLLTVATAYLRRTAHQAR